MTDRPRWGIRTALISCALSSIITSAFVLIWPRQTIAQCIYAYAQVPPEGLIWIDADMAGCDEAIEEATKSGNVAAAAFGASYFSVYKNDDRKHLYYLRRAVELGDNDSILQLVSELLYGSNRETGETDTSKCPDVLRLLNKYKVHSVTQNDESERDYYQREKWHFEDYRAECSPSSSKANIGSRHAAD